MAILRLAHLRAKPAPSAQSFAIPGAEAVGRPAATAFLRSEREVYYIKNEFRTLVEARRFATNLRISTGPSCMPQHPYCRRSSSVLTCTGLTYQDLELTSGGVGRAAYVVVKKTGRAHVRTIAKGEAVKREAAQLERALGPAAAAVPPAAESGAAAAVGGAAVEGVEPAAGAQVLGKRSSNVPAAAPAKCVRAQSPAARTSVREVIVIDSD